MSERTAMLIRKEEATEKKDTPKKSDGGCWPGVWSDGRLNTHPEKRTHERIPSKLQARFFLGNAVYTGTITNLSEKGMFISTDVSLPLNYRLEVLVRLKGNVLKIPARIKRSVQSDNHLLPDPEHGMGVELTSFPRAYLQYINTLRSAV
jgi:hypothetical protein